MIDQVHLVGLLAEVDPGLGVPDELRIEIPAVADPLDEGIVVVVDQALEVLAFLLLEFLQRSAGVLELAGGESLVGEADLLGEVAGVDPRADDADRADDRASRAHSSSQPLAIQ